MDDKLQQQRQRAEQGEIEETREDLKREQKQTPDAEDAPREEVVGPGTSHPAFAKPHSVSSKLIKLCTTRLLLFANRESDELKGGGEGQCILRWHRDDAPSPPPTK